MRLEDQIITLKQAKRLFELGVKHPANFHWVLGRVEIEEQEGENSGDISFEQGYAIFLLQEFTNYTQFIKISMFTNEDVEFHWGEGGEERVELSDPMYPAYTVAELGELLPDALKGKNGESIINAQRKHFNNSEWIYSYKFQKTGLIAIAAPILPTEAQVRAAMLILLLENGYTPFNQSAP